MNNLLKPIIMENLIKLAEKYDIEKIILFGSRAIGKNSERSDIDLAVLGKNVRDFSFDAEEYIPTLLKFDITDLTDPHGKAFLDEIHRTGVVIYEKTR